MVFGRSPEEIIRDVYNDPAGDQPDMSEAEFVRQAKAKMDQFGGLLDPEGAAIMVINEELGVM